MGAATGTRFSAGAAASGTAAAVVVAPPVGFGGENTAAKDSGTAAPEAANGQYDQPSPDWHQKYSVSTTVGDDPDAWLKGRPERKQAIHIAVMQEKRWDRNLIQESVRMDIMNNGSSYQQQPRWPPTTTWIPSWIASML